MKTYDRNRNAITAGSRVMVATNGATGVIRKSVEKANQKNNYAALTACLSKVWKVCSAQWI